MNTSTKPKMPRWVKVSGIGAILVLLVFAIYHLSGHGFHHQHHS